MVPLTYIKHSNKPSVNIPAIGLGTHHLTGADGKEAIRTAIDLGYRMFDTAPAYHNEVIVGEAIRDAICERDDLNREDFLIISKLSGSHHRLDLVETCCRMSAARLGVDYIDLYLMHTPVAFKCHGENNSSESRATFDIDDETEPIEAWLGIEHCYQKGLCRSIGVSNFNESQLESLIRQSNVAPAVNQIECSIGFNQESLLDFCRKQNIRIVGFAPLGNQKLAFSKDDRVKAVARETGKTATQVSLRYLVEKGVIPIPKSKNHIRQQENLNIFDFELTEQQMQGLDALGGNKRACEMRFLRDSQHYPFT